MTGRVIFLAFITITLTFFALMTSTGTGQLILLIFPIAFAIYSIFTIRSFIRLKVQHDALVISDWFGVETIVPFNTITAWQLRKIYLQSRLRKSMILTVNSEQISISNYDSVQEFDKLYDRLKAEYSALEVT